MFHSETPLEIAAEAGDIETVRKLELEAEQKQEFKKEEQTRALIFATIAGHLEVVKEILSHGEVETRHDVIRIFAACIHPSEVKGQMFSIHEALLFAVTENHLAIVQLLMEKGAGQNVRNEYTLLMEAARRSYINIVKQLLTCAEIAKTVNERRANGDKETALIFAAEVYYKNDKNGFDSVAVIEELLDKGALIDVQTEWGYTPLMKAAENNRLHNVEVLLRHGARVDLRTKTTTAGETALSLAVKNGHAAVVGKLLDYHAPIDADIAEHALVKTYLKNKKSFSSLIKSITQPKPDEHKNPVTACPQTKFQASRPKRMPKLNNQNQQTANTANRNGFTR